ncbi:FadR/GntR family transcriptional regulator [Allonocardiopsis opalescens]|uniref:GntR family transcriptional regulator n=1 Tax=Allonocardiopsis opalescens TaxID=1144618 RepID=A0A2T0Q0S2_9ACTN|nr:FCD domain-containing protein [Allonocardiopsis opalescens]PRX97389.1 GntR family transcriptional regulator [Allonocardiopsis opalescens]
MAAAEETADAPPGAARGPHRTLHNRVLAELGPSIAAGEYAPGHAFTLDGLERRFQVSRTVVREAVRVLESMRLVVSRPRTGVTVRPVAAWNVFDPQLIRWRLAGAGRPAQLRSLTELRAAVEPPAAAAAARRASPAARERLLALGELMTASGHAGDLDTFLGHDIEFHAILLRESGNEMFAGLSGLVAEVLTGRTAYHLMPEHPRAEALRLHALVASAVHSGLPGVAEAAMREIVAEVGVQIERIAPGEPGPFDRRPG